MLKFFKKSTVLVKSTQEEHVGTQKANKVFDSQHHDQINTNSTAKKELQNANLNIKSANNSTILEPKTWKQESHEIVIVQRNFLLLGCFISTLLVVGVLAVLRYVKNEKSIEPFVIEVEKKSGIPTVVKPETIKIYSSNEAIVRYFITLYVRSREEYSATTFPYDYNSVVRVLSSSEVYAQYANDFSPNNPQSPASILGNTGITNVGWRSILLLPQEQAQIRITLTGTNGTQDKIIYLKYAFQNMEMNESDRRINPLGFVILSYSIANETAG